MAEGVKKPEKPKVLVVDDDPNVLTAIQRLLHGRNYEVIPTNGPVDALTVLNEQEVAVVITDHMMPGMNGIELLILTRETWPKTRSIMVTGTTDLRVAADSVNKNLVDYFVTKPWDNAYFLQLIDKAVDAYQRHSTDASPSDLRSEIRSETLTPGEVLPRPFGKYYLIERIACGGMAQLYRAKLYGSGGFEKDLAIKKLLPHLSSDKAVVQMFMNEAMIMVTLSHANIVSAIDFGELNGEYYLVMEYVDGAVLSQLIDLHNKQAARMPIALACFIAQQVSQGLHYAYRKKGADNQPLHVVHRDINPQNVLVSLEGNVKIADFGIARAANRVSVTEIGIVKGTLAYMSPEQVCGEPVDSRSDIYSLGVVLYEMLTNQVPFLGGTHRETVAFINRGVYQKPDKLNQEVGKTLSAIVQKALHRNPKRRYQTAAEMGEDLSNYLRQANLHPDAAALADIVTALRGKL